MKEYKKAELIAKNLPTGSYAAGCPRGQRTGVAGGWVHGKRKSCGVWVEVDLAGKAGCELCEIAQ